ncbi:MAG TPA: hypothetical protein VK177_01135 [Flavobacteriales bacterium]|nr:hypothetical protein [Flavobacteriales bacterium]
MKPFILSLVLALLTCTCLRAQDTTKTETANTAMYFIETNDGSSFTGTLVRENDKEIVLKTSVGEVTVQKSNIHKIKQITKNDFKNGVYWFENPNSTRYIVGPSAFGLKKGEGYYQNMYLFIQSFNVGLTKNFSIGGGTEIASLLFGGAAPAITFLTPKFSFEVGPKVHLGTGILYLHTGLDNKASYGIGYGLATFGSSNTNFTLGLGWGYHSVMRYSTTYNQTTQQYTNTSYKDKGISPNPIVTFSGMARLAKRFSLITENWVFPTMKTTYDNYGNSITKSQYDFIVSYGARFMGEKMAVDFGFLNSPEWSNWIRIGIPYIDFVVKFGGDKNKTCKK